MKSLKFMIISFIALLVFSGGIFLITHDFSPVTNENQIEEQIEEDIDESSAGTGNLSATINVTGGDADTVSGKIGDMSASHWRPDGIVWHYYDTFTISMYKGYYLKNFTFEYRYYNPFSFTITQSSYSGTPSISTSHSHNNSVSVTDNTSDSNSSYGLVYSIGCSDVNNYNENSTGFTSSSYSVTLGTEVGGHEYTIKYSNYNEFGTYHPTSATFGQGVKISNPTKTGYTFDGWTCSYGNSSTAQLGQDRIGYSNKRIYTSWDLTTKTKSQYFKNLTPSRSSITMKANWTANPCTVTLNVNNSSYGHYTNYSGGADRGTSLTIVSYYDRSISVRGKNIWSFGDSDSTDVNATAYTGYSFSGYSVGSGYTIQSDVTITASFVPNIYTITLNNQSATTSGTTTVYEKYSIGWYSDSGVTSSLSKISIPVRIGYTFGGYYTSTGGGGTQIINSSGNIVGASTSFSSDTTLYAKWTAKSVTLTLDANGGRFTNGTTATYARNYGTTITDLPAPNTPKTGYHFGGWYATFNGSSTKLNFGRAYMYTNALSVHLDAYMENWSTYANNTMRLISCTEGGGFNIEPSDGKIQFSCYDSGIDYKVATASKTWSSLSSGWHSFDLVFTGSLVYGYVDGVQVANSANYQSAAIGYCSTNSLYAGAEASGSDTTPAGQYFNGYIGNVIIKNQNSIITTDLTTSWTYPADNVTLYARWIPNTYSISYTLNDGSYGTYHPTTAIYDTAFTVSNPSRTNYTFAGWDITDMDGVTHTYGSSTTTATSITKTKETSFKNLHSTGGTVKFSAQWEPKVYTVTLNKEGGSGGNDNVYEKYNTCYFKTITSGVVSDQITSSANPISVPTKAGYVFGGYYLSTSYVDNQQYINSYGYLTSNALTNKFSNDDASQNNLYAKWLTTWLSSSGDRAEPEKVGEVYQISSAKNLAWLAYQVDYGGNATINAVQTQDISLSGKSWYPIGTSSSIYMGVYDGQGYQITGLTIYEQTNGGVTGLFGYIGRSVTNVFINGADIKGKVYAGGIAGYMDGGRVEKCIVYNSTISGGTVGGIVGYAKSNATINTNIFKGTFTATTKGLICGYYTGKITDCLGVSSQTGLILNPSGSRENCMSVLNNTASYSSNGGQTDSFTNWQTAPEGMFAPKLPKALFWIAY